VTLISIVVTNQSRALAEREIAALETQLISTKREELKNYLSIARTSFVNTYGRAAPDDEAAKLQVTQLLSAILYGQDGYFFVFDYDGNNLVAPRQTYLINRNWSGLEDATGVAITDELIRIARTGGGYHSFDWPKPSTGETGRMIVYVNGLQDWRWVVGTGIFIDDVQDTVANALRPGVLDDLGLGPALQSLAEDFGQRTGVAITMETVVFRNRLDQDARIALYRIAQEALTNIERHADAKTVAISLKGNRTGAQPETDTQRTP